MIYFYDGTEDGFYTAFLQAFADPEAYLTAGQQQLILGQECVYVRTDATRARKAKARFWQLDKECGKELTLLLRSGDGGKDQIAFRYFYLIAQEKHPVRQMLSNEDVLNATECLQRIESEIHRLHGFLRFMESQSGALYAPCSPDHDIVDLLLPHFKARLSQFPFVIHDVKRKKAAVYDGEHTFVAPLEQAELVLSAEEEGWQALWKRYYKSVNIPSRQRLKQMKGYLPVRYWKFLPEKNISPDEL
jgi:probable DNA metabolism protein